MSQQIINQNEEGSSSSYGETKSVLSIQSHVVHGYVGNRTSTFPLQTLGWDVDVLNTVQLSNHTGYGKVYGQQLSADEIWTQYEGLRNIGMHEEYHSVLTGYVPTADGTKTVGKIAIDIVESRRQKIKQREGGSQIKDGVLPSSSSSSSLSSEPDEVIWILDPVIGDNGRFYVSQEVIPIYRELLQSGAVSAVTPNQFEAEILTGITIKTKQDVFKVLEKFHKEYKVPHVILTSMKLEEDSETILSVASSSSVRGGVGEVGGTESGGIEVRPFYYEYPSLNAYITGTGDLFAGLLVDRLYKYISLEKTGGLKSIIEKKMKQEENKEENEENEEDKSNPKYLPLSFALGEVLGVVQAVIRRTLANPSLKTTPGGIYGNIPSMKNAELRLIQSRDLIPGTEIPYQVKEFVL